MQDNLPELCTHLLHIDAHPTTYAVPWMLYAFSSVLPADQTLLLWDRILGFDSLELLPVLAAAIFAYRAKWLMQAADSDKVGRTLQNLTALKVVPLLQLFLWDKEALVQFGATS